MSTTQSVTFGGVHVRGAWNTAMGDDPVAEVAFYTPTGQARLAQLDVDALLTLAGECIEAVEQLRTRERRVAEARARHRPVSRDDSARAMLHGRTECPWSRCPLPYLHSGPHGGEIVGSIS